MSGRETAWEFPDRLSQTYCEGIGRWSIAKEWAANRLDAGVGVMREIRGPDRCVFTF